MHRKYLLLPLLLMTVLLLGYLIVVNTTTTDATTTDTFDVVSKVTEIEEVEIEEETFKPFYELSEHERWIVECMVMGEAEGESYTGKLLVALCILNASLKDNIPPSEVRIAYKYSGWNENPNDDVKNAVSEVFDYGYKVTEEPILYFYAPKWCTSAWHETQRHVITEGGHKFFAQWED